MKIRRKYESGTASCFWRWTDVVFEGWTYLVRLHVVKLEWLARRQLVGCSPIPAPVKRGAAVMLHWFHGADPQPDPHDHPVSFLSIVLRGGYVEWRPGNPRHRVRWFNFLRATDVHRILEVEPGTVTLVFSGPKVREWGFWTPTGWVGWREYNGGGGPKRQ